MPDTQLNARTFVLTALLAAGATASPALRGPAGLAGIRSAQLVFATGYVGGTVSFKSAVTAGAQYRDVYDKAGVKVTIPAAKNRAIDMPVACLVGQYGLKTVSAVKQTTTAGANLVTVVGQD